MKFYCGIDLSARDCHVCVIDEQLKVMVQQKLRNELPKIIQLLEPYKANLKIVVESTFNWYWLIDGCCLGVKLCAWGDAKSRTPN